jgi:cytochrome c biogenesis protein CcdA
MTAAFNPCAFALLPTYLGLYLGQAAHCEQHSLQVQLPRALLVSVAMTISAVGLFGAAGLALGLAGTALGGLLSWLSVAVGVLLALAGGRLLAGDSLQSATADRLADALGSMVSHSGLVGYATYGLAFAFSSLGCALPLFLAVVGTCFYSQRSYVRAGAAGAHALGMGTVVTTLTMLMALLGSGVVARTRRVPSASAARRSVVAADWRLDRLLLAISRRASRLTNTLV